MTGEIPMSKQATVKDIIQASAKIEASDIISYCAWMGPLIAVISPFAVLAWKVAKAFW